MGELANCARCDELFVKSLREICKNCYNEEEKAFKTVNQFLRLRKNREASLTEIVEETGVSGKLITKFIKEKRLLVSQFPNLGYPCEKCGDKIKAGRLCKSCSEELLQNLDNETRENERAKRLKETDNKQAVYYSYKKDR